ncbi:hypothetical protein JM83_1532 [Gillisia sp. Hel_I_86]|uniref:hypothetical protein n=1 Tax=Gillisia sp. Hel_I_86 TaxID=1249981 RepID=UPI00119A36C8|nr:hypothetical protein [Gillisia sp. Hel_I_86]TVZ26558.1 hypothetical protein JM83_1532 [Gillisia sp. Hel_I_86]
MSKIEEIVHAINIELIKQNKNYITLGQANKILFEEGIISEKEKTSGFLKSLLEEKKIAHAQKTQSAPRQWRIFSSDKNWKKEKNLNKEKNRIRKSKLKKEDNQFKVSSKAITIGIIVIIIIGFTFLDDGKSNSILAYNVASLQVEQRLKSPSTAEFPGTFEKKNHIENLGENNYLINSWVDSQNGFGATVRSYWSCEVYADGENFYVNNLIIR